jgi:hypothetical protein
MEHQNRWIFSASATCLRTLKNRRDGVIACGDPYMLGDYAMRASAGDQGRAICTVR